MQELANRILRDTGFSRITPVPIIEVMNRLGVKVYSVQMNPRFIGSYLAEDKKFRQTYRTNAIAAFDKELCGRWARFYLAYELGKWLQSNQENYYSVTNLGDFRDEQAKDFARYLLMPDVSVRRVSPEDWQDEFEIPFEVAAKRLMEVEEWDTV